MSQKENDMIKDICVVKIEADSDNVGKNQHKPDKKESSLGKPNDKDEEKGGRRHVACILF